MPPFAPKNTKRDKKAVKAVEEVQKPSLKSKKERSKKEQLAPKKTKHDKKPVKLVVEEPVPSPKAVQKKEKKEVQKVNIEDEVELEASGSSGEEEEEEEVEEPEEESDAEESEEDEDVHLHGFSTDDDDSSDEEDAMDDEPVGIDIGKLPTIAKDDATVQRKLEKAKRQPNQDRGVIYLARLPHGFYEDQLRGYFSQFGDITRLRVSRNRKTGRSKHYGFIEFDSASVAQIVAETMDNYLLTGHILRCNVIPKDKVHPDLWVGANKKWKVVPRDRVTRVQHNKTRTEEGRERAEKRLIKRQEERKRKIEEAGIKYNFEAVSYKKKPKSS